MSDVDERIARDFFARDLEEQQDLLKNTWCNECQEIDLGMVNPVEYEFLERIYIDGECAKCGEMTTTEVVYEDEDEDGDE